MSKILNAVDGIVNNFTNTQLYNKYNSIFSNKTYEMYALNGFGILFVLWVLSMKKNCPCPNKKNSRKCYRLEYFGVQPNHLYTFMFLGYFFPERFILIQLAGIVWEVFEYYIDKDIRILNTIGGCLDPLPKKNKLDYSKNNIVSKNREKYYNSIDRFFKIKNSKKHGWHHSVAEIVVNIIGFLMGRFINQQSIPYYSFLLGIICFVAVVE